RANAPDPALLAAIGRMTEMLRHLCLGDGMPARFNGMGPGERGALASVLAYGAGRPAAPVAAERSGYVRLERGSTTAIVDARPPPPPEVGGAGWAARTSPQPSS